MSKFNYYLTVFILFAAGAFLLQSKLFLCGDVAYLLHVTQLMLTGGTYAKDFFETNPPMILMLYMPVVLAAKYFSINIILMLRLYILAWVFLSVTICYLILGKLENKKNHTQQLIYICTLFYALLILPAGDFGQREHLFMTLFLPYVFSAIAFAENKDLPSILKIIVGFMAGLGIGMKPFFSAPLLLIEGIIILQNKSLWRAFRIETFIIAIVLMLYLGFVYWFEPTYVQVILPLVSHLYFISARETWKEFFSHTPVIFCLLLSGYIVFIVWQKKLYLFDWILIAGFLGSIIAFVMPRSAWYYHLIPALIFGMLLLTRWILQHGRSLSFAVALVTMPIVYSFFYSYEMILVKQHSDRSHMIAYLRSQSQIHSVNCFSASYTQDCFPLIYMANKNYAGRSPFFWWLTGLVALENKNPHTFVFQSDKDYLINAIIDDLNGYKADVVIVNQKDFTQKLGPHFDALEYFSQNQAFRSAWSHYYFVTQMGDYQLFRRRIS